MTPKTHTRPANPSLAFLDVITLAEQKVRFCPPAFPAGCFDSSSRFGFPVHDEGNRRDRFVQRRIDQEPPVAGHVRSFPPSAHPQAAPQGCAADQDRFHRLHEQRPAAALRLFQEPGGTDFRSDPSVPVSSVTSASLCSTEHAVDAEASASVHARKMPSS